MIDRPGPRARPVSSAPPLAPGSPPQAADIMPPFLLPGEHFVAALVWLGAGATGLVLISRALAVGAFLAPSVIATTHCFTLGWITTSIFGALYQLFPVVLGVPSRSVRVGHVTFWVLQAGVSVLVVGSWLWVPALLAVGWVLLFAAVGGLAWNIFPQRRKATRGRLIGLYISAGHSGLGLAMVVTLARLGHIAGWYSVDRLGLLVAHAHLAVVGFATLTIVGVGSRLLPMFLLSRGHPVWPLHWIGPVLGGGLLLFSAGTIWRISSFTTVGGLGMAAGIALHLYMTVEYFRTRARRSLDPGLAHVLASSAFLAAATCAGLTLLLGFGRGAQLIAAYGLLGILGWVTLFVAGIYWRILPFLTWMHRFSPRVGKQGLPTVAELSAPRLGWASLLLLSAGVAGLVWGAAAGLPQGTRLGAWVFAAGVALMLLEKSLLVVRR